MNYRPSQTLNGAYKGQPKSKEEAKPHSFQIFNKQYEKVEELNEDTMTKPIAMSKIKISFDEQQTKKIGWERGFSNLIKPNKQIVKEENPIIEKNEAGAQHILQIPKNKKVEEILNKKPLRERFSHLLPSQFQLTISYDHQQIIKRMQLIDRTIQFLSNHRGIKIHFFDTIRRSIFQSTSMVIDLKIIQQLLFLDEHCYSIEWRMNQKIKRYDIKIVLPKLESMDVRKAQMRKKIVKYLIYKEAQFLTQNRLTKVDNFKWHDQFDIKRIQIPEKSLPVHPNSISSDIRTFANEQIEKISNPNLKAIFKTKKHNTQVKSLSSASVADMIFSKIPSSQITNQILQSVKEKQKINNQIRQRERNQGERVDKEAILKIFDEILVIYMSKNVSNIFKATLIQLLQQRLKIRDSIILQYVEKILQVQGMNCLKRIESSKKVQVIQIDKQKFKQMRTLLDGMF